MGALTKTEMISMLDKLFKEWIKRSKQNGEAVDDTEEHNVIFTRDGIVQKYDKSIDAVQDWIDSKKRIMFILKDQNTKYSDDLTNWLDSEDNRNLIGPLLIDENGHKHRSRFVRNIANVFWGLWNADPDRDCRLEESDYDDVRQLFNTMPFALVESKKQGGGPKIGNKILYDYLSKYGDLLNRELDILKPNMIVCTSWIIYDFVLKRFPQNELLRVPEETPNRHNSIRIHPQSKTIIFCSYHPSAPNISYTDFYEGVMSHYRAYLNSDLYFEF